MSYGTTVIFSIDDPCRAQLEAFQRHIVAHGMTDRIKPLIGCYKGQEEPSFIMPLSAFSTCVELSDFVLAQESFLIVSGCNKMYARLKFRGPENLDRPYEGLGSMCAVSETVARSYDSWTYRPDTDTWYICAHINPDHSGDIPLNPAWVQADPHYYLDDLQLSHGEKVVCASNMDGEDLTVGSVYTVQCTTSGIAAIVTDSGHLTCPSARFKRLDARM